MLIAILALYFAHYRSTGVYTFEDADLLHTPLNPHAACGSCWDSSSRLR